MQHNLRLVLFAMNKYFQDFVNGPKFQDLCQAGVKGLITAIDRFEPKRRFRLSTYSLFWIRHAIIRSMTVSSFTRVSFGLESVSFFFFTANSYMCFMGMDTLWLSSPSREIRFGQLNVWDLSCIVDTTQLLPWNTKICWQTSLLEHIKWLNLLWLQILLVLQLLNCKIEVSYCLSQREAHLWLWPIVCRFERNETFVELVESTTKV